MKSKINRSICFDTWLIFDSFYSNYFFFLVANAEKACIIATNMCCANLSDAVCL